MRYKYPHVKNFSEIQCKFIAGLIYYLNLENQEYQI